MRPRLKSKRDPRPPKLNLGKMTIRKFFLGVGIASWFIGLIGCVNLGFGLFTGLGLIVITMFHGLILLTVFRRKPLDRRIVESNVVFRPVS